MKKLLLIVCLALFIGMFLARLTLLSTQVKWGHHFTFKNELGLEINSLSITIGSEINMIRKTVDEPNFLGGNLGVPKKGYPHEVIIKVFSQEGYLVIPADSFDCYNCDGSHSYILTDLRAVYQFIN
ncbi:MAG: hypothetical protein AAGI38_16130 [Bacteroidota bacterium]